MDSDSLQKENRVLSKKIKILYLFLFLACAVIAAFSVYLLKERGLFDSNAAHPYSVPPHMEAVNKVIKPLQYSGIPMFVDRNVYLTLDFERKMWTLHNVHAFDDKGELILQEGKYGTCGELAEYTASRVRPIFGDGYDISFVMASQSGFFLTPRSSHIVLRIVDKSNKRNVYILDPSFHRYGPLVDFDDYLFFGKVAGLDFMEDKKTDITQPFNKAIPLLIRGNYLVGFVVESMDDGSGGRYFIFGLTMNKKYNYSGRYLFALRDVNGETEAFENKKLGREILSEQEWGILTKKISGFFEKETASNHW